MTTYLTDTYNRKVRKMGTSLGVTFPKEICGALNLKQGEKVTFRLMNDEIKLVPYDPEYDKLIAIGNKVMKKHRKLLSDLAKGSAGNLH